MLGLRWRAFTSPPYSNFWNAPKVPKGHCEGTPLTDAPRVRFLQKKAWQRTSYPPGCSRTLSLPTKGGFLQVKLLLKFKIHHKKLIACAEAGFCLASVFLVLFQRRKSTQRSLKGISPFRHTPLVPGGSPRLNASKNYASELYLCGTANMQNLKKINLSIPQMPKLS